jgi:putative tryptophan/tyrosine transport system ATP-binding protein
MLGLHDVHVTFNPDTPSEVKALRGLSLQVNQGDFVTIIGANGAGKSTLFNVIAGTVSPEQGTIKLGGNAINRWSEVRRSAHIGRVFQNPALGTCAGLTVMENLSLSSMRGKMRGLRPGVKRADRERFYELLRGMNMGLETRLDTDVALLSGGQRQAVTLLMATLSQPEILLLDEHTAALDPNAAAQIIDLTIKMAEEQHLTVIMITHSMHQACEVGSRVVMMNRGNILFEIQGAEREALTFEHLIERFRALNTLDVLSDRTLLE